MDDLATLEKDKKKIAEDLKRQDRKIVLARAVQAATTEYYALSAGNAEDPSSAPGVEDAPGALSVFNHPNNATAEPSVPLSDNKKRELVFVAQKYFSNIDMLDGKAYKFSCAKCGVNTPRGGQKLHPDNPFMSVESVHKHDRSKHAGTGQTTDEFKATTAGKEELSDQDLILASTGNYDMGVCETKRPPELKKSRRSSINRPSAPFPEEDDDEEMQDGYHPRKHTPRSRRGSKSVSIADEDSLFMEKY